MKSAVIQRVGKKKKHEKVQWDAKGMVILTEDKSDAVRSVLVLSHRDSGSFRRNELKVHK